MSARHFDSHDKILLLQHGCTELLALAQRRGVELHKLLSGTSIFEQDLQRPHGRLHHADWLKLLRNCQHQLKSPELPFLLGNAMLNSRYIAVCQSLQYAKNLKQALCHLYYFRHQLFPGLYARLYQQNDHIVIEFKAALGLASQQPFMLTIVCSLLLSLIKQQLGSLTGVSVQLQHDSADHQLWGCELSVNQPCDTLRIPLPLWLHAFHDADPAQFKAARRTCRQLNHVLIKQRGVLESICRLQQRALPQLLSQEQVASALGLSNSTLKRLLSRHGTNFARLIDELRRDAARNLLQQGQYSNRQLALKLGYSDEHNFRRAFKRWTGLIPSSFKGMFHFN
jgi:AraC-like DNA-binding protein